MELTTPNGALVRIEGTNALEASALQRYVAEMIGPAGLKHTVALLDAYFVQTCGHAQKEDARVSLRQMLERVGMGHRADDRDEQFRFMSTILYLASSYITAEEKLDARRGPPPPYARQRRRKDRKDYSPLLVIERLKPGPDGSISIPDEVQFHLGNEFFDTMFGESLAYFEIPTRLLLGYHAWREQHELLLAMYFASRVQLSAGLSVHFQTLLEQSALSSSDEIARDAHRTRDAARVLRALERLETDGLIIREPHADADLFHAVDLILSHVTALELAPATATRIQHDPYRTLHSLRDTDLRARQRQAVQRLLGGRGSNAKPLQFKVGPLLQEQHRKRAAARLAATERDERATTARITRNVVTAARTELGLAASKSGRKRRGRNPRGSRQNPTNGRK